MREEAAESRPSSGVLHGKADLQSDWPRQRDFAIDTQAHGCVIRAGVLPISGRTGSLELPYGSATGYEKSLGVD